MRLHTVSALSMPVLAAFLCSATLSAQAAPRSILFGVRAGVMTPGAFYVAEGLYDSYDLSMSPSVGLSLDYRVAPRLWAGVFSDFTTLNAADESAPLIEGGVTLKAEVGSEASVVRVRPLLAVGYGTLGAVDAMSSTQYLTLAAGAEILHGPLFLEISAYGAPSGGNAAVTTSFGPVARIRVGRLF
jgi:hypothetical protein